MTFTFRPAIREQASVLIALAGASGSGKTYSALRLARGLVGPQGRIAVIDTEAGRALHYADQFAFDHGDLHPPFRPEAYQSAMAAADDGGYGAIVIDSFSHEYEGEGGILEWAEQLEAEGVKKPGNWKLPKTQHKRLVSRMLQCRAHLIFCLRAEEKMLVKREVDPQTGRPKTVVVAPEDRPLRERWAPICEKRFMFEMTASFLLLPDRPGVPVPVKLQEQHRAAFPEGRPIEESCGAALAAWAHGGKPAASNEGEKIIAPAAVAEQVNAALNTLRTKAASVADNGTGALRDWFAKLSPEAKALIKPDLDAVYKAAAAAADEKLAGAGAEA